MGESAAVSPADSVTVALDGAPAQILADQALTIQDLQFVMECCKRLLTELAKPEEDREAVIPQALWSAALSAYARCFGQGKRFGLTTDDVRALPLQGAVMKFHHWVIAERGKVTAHPANPFEVARVGAVLSPPGQQDRRVEGIAVLSASHVLVDDIGVRQLGGLASELAKQIAEKAQKQQDAVLADAQQAGVDRLDKLQPLQTGPPADDPAG